jgi:hypothetical protein
MPRAAAELEPMDMHEIVAKLMMAEEYEEEAEQEI